MRRILSVFIAACLVLLLFTWIFVSMPSAREDITEGYYTYTVAGSNATITGYTGSGGAVAIPDKLGGCPVVGIGVTSTGDGAFEWCTGLTSVTIPNSVTSIGDSAFGFCTALTSVTIGSGVTTIANSAFFNCTALTEILVNGDNLNYASVDGVLYDKDITVLIQYPIGNTRTSFTIPKSVTSIGDGAFEWCMGLTGVTIPSSVTSIGDSAFFNCMGLTSVTIPNSVTSIGDDAFNGTGLTSVTIPNSVTSIGDGAFEYTGLTEILVNGDNLNYASVDGVLYDKDITVLIQYPVLNTRTSFTIPNSVTSIGIYAFFDCTGLTSVTIGSGVTSIGIYAFFDCTALTSVTIPNGVTSIGDSAFGLCTALTSVTIPNSVTSIGDKAFDACTGLTEILVNGDNLNYASVDGVLYDKDITVLMQYPVLNTRTSFTIPNSVTSIGIYAFAGCTALTSVTIPNSVTSIGDGAFNACTGLTEILVNGDNLNYASVDGVLYDKDITVLIQYPIRNTRTSFTIPNSVTTIGIYAFFDCTGLTSVTIPNSLTSIGNDAFDVCTGLTAAHFVGNAPTMGTDVFRSCAIGFTVKHLADTTGWSNPWYGYPTAIEKKSTKEQTVLVLHIGKSTFTINGRTMLPLRFVAENLGATVGWDQSTQTITITYQQ